MIAVDGYVHYHWINTYTDPYIGVNFYDNFKAKKDTMYYSHLKNSLKKQWTTKFRRQRSRATLAGNREDINAFIKETEYGRKIAEQLNKVMTNQTHGFTSARQIAPGVSFGTMLSLNPETIEQLLLDKISQGSKPITRAAAELRQMSQSLNSVLTNLSDYIYALLLEEPNSTDRQIVQNILSKHNNQLIEIPSSLSYTAQKAIQDYNKVIIGNQELLNCANDLSACITGGGNFNTETDVANGLIHIASFLNTFGGFIGEVASYAGIYAAIIHPELREHLKAIFHSGDQTSLTKFLTQIQGQFLLVDVKEELDPKFEELLKKANLSDQKILKDDVEFILSWGKEGHGQILGSVGLNIKNSGEIDQTGRVRPHKTITLDSSDSLAVIIRKNVEYGTLPADLGAPNVYRNLAAALPWGLSRVRTKKGAQLTNQDKKSRKVYNNLTGQWTNYLNLVATSNFLTALMGRLSNAQISAGNNALIFVLNGRYIAVDEIMEKLVEQANNNNFFITSQSLHIDSGLHRSVAEKINLNNFQERKKGENNTEAALRRSSIVVNELDTQFFSKKITTKISMGFFVSQFGFPI